MIKQAIALFILLASVWNLHAQAPDRPATLRQHFSSFCQHEFQEKVYLQTDKAFYVTGEYIWFRAYRTDASSHLPNLYSRFIYVELYDARDRFVSRIKVIERNGVFAGSFPIPEYIPSGKYNLRAYTYWMQNFQEEFYFRKEITIENITSGRVRRETLWDTTANGDWLLSLRILSANGLPFEKLFVESRQYTRQKEVDRSVSRVEGNGRMQLRIRKEDSVSTVRLQFLNKEPFEYIWILQVPVRMSDSETDIRFFPEGGNLIAGITSRIGFKAVGADGFGAEVSGEVFRDDGTPVVPFVAAHRGMGYFSLKPEAGRSYYAEVILPGGGKKSVELPDVKEQGVALQVTTDSATMQWKCLANPGYLKERELYLLVHCRGKLLSVLPIGEGICGSLPLHALTPGIIHGVLTDGEGNLYSSRMAFVYPKEAKEVTLSTDRKQYAKRDSVLMTVECTGEDSISCSVAVTDSLLSGDRRWDNNIVSYFLLDSDLKGHIEDPGWYFDPGIQQAYRSRMMDILLMTQGWQRFDVTKAVRKEYSKLPFFLELTQGFSGKLKNFWGRPAKQPRLFAIVPRLKMIREIPIDSTSSFDFCVEYPDSTEFIFQSFTQAGRKWIELVFNKDSIRNLQIPLMSRHGWKNGKEEEDSVYREVGTLGYYYMNGQKIYRLEEAVITKPKYLSGTKPLKVLKAHDLKEERFKVALDWVRSIPGIRIENTGGMQSIIYGHSDNIRLKQTHIFLEGTPEDFGDVDMPYLLANIPINYIDQAEYTTSVDDLHMYIFLKFKKGTDFTLRGLDFYRFIPLGYHQPAEFYVPRYEVKEERSNPLPDERPTLFWNPDVRLRKGEPTTLRFYTTDRQGPFTVKLEGITTKGEMIRSTMTIETSRKKY